jgi:hypothetical protein
MQKVKAQQPHLTINSSHLKDDPHVALHQPPLHTQKQTLHFLHGMQAP